MGPQAVRPGCPMTLGVAARGDGEGSADLAHLVEAEVTYVTTEPSPLRTGRFSLGAAKRYRHISPRFTCRATRPHPPTPRTQYPSGQADRRLFRVAGAAGPAPRRVLVEEPRGQGREPIDPGAARPAGAVRCLLVDASLGEDHTGALDSPRRDRSIVLWVMWEPKERLKTTQVLRIFDLNNKLVGESRPGKLNLAPGPYSYTYWPLDISKLPAATYRVDVVIGAEPAWRGYLRISE